MIIKFEFIISGRDMGIGLGGIKVLQHTQPRENDSFRNFPYDLARDASRFAARNEE